VYQIIVNPIAGRGRTPERLALLTHEFDALGLPYEVYHTKCVMDGHNKAKEICETLPNCTGIIGLGGDGTLQEIADGMWAAFNGKIPIPLGIFPAGSGNDFVMSLYGAKTAALARYKKHQIPAAARAFARSIAAHRTRTVDLITANNAAFMNIGNLGLDAHIVQNALALKERFGRYAYLAAVYKSIAGHKNIPLSIQVNGEKIDDTFTLVAICNGQYYGGGLHISPTASITDGKITLCLVRGMTRPKTMLIFPSLMIEQHTRLKAVSFMECTELTITAQRETLCLDGNLYPQTQETTFHFKVQPRVLDVFL
jgi:diacylglycerol kinase family enzyme